MSTPPPTPDSNSDATTLRDISPRQWKSGIPAWLGWMFDGLAVRPQTLVLSTVHGGMISPLVVWANSVASPEAARHE